MVRLPLKPGGIGVNERFPKGALTTVANNFTATQTFSNGVVFGAGGLGSGLVWNDTPTFDAANVAGNFIRFQTYITAKNGINARTGGVGDSITSDNSNGAGSSFFFNDYRPMQLGGAVNSKGSAQIYTAQGTLSDSGDGGSPKYREMGLYEGSLTADSAGAYCAVMEGGMFITAGKPSRVNGVAILVSETNTLASYAGTVGATSIYADTGSRAFAAQSVGSQPGGTGYHVYGDFARALLCTFFNQANNVFESRAQNNANPFVQMNGLGTIKWGAGGASAPDITLTRGAAAILALTGSLQISGTGNLFMAGGVISFNGNAQAAYTTATAGTNGALPAQVAGYVLIVDNNGTNRKVPYYAV